VKSYRALISAVGTPTQEIQECASARNGMRQVTEKDGLSHYIPGTIVRKPPASPHHSGDQHLEDTRRML
jgi:hypothetical protein